MRYIVGMFFLLMFSTPSFSQNYEVGPFVGGANYIGDVGNSAFIRPNSWVLGGLFKWNQSTRHSYRFSLLYATVSGDDAESMEIHRRERGWEFTNQILEASLGVEFNWFEYDPFEATQQATPYFYTGVNYYSARHFKLDEPYNTAILAGDQVELEKAGSNWEFSIPMVFGYKLTLNSWMSGGVELGARYTFTDNLDGSAPSEIDEDLVEFDFGNRNNSDWYIFTGMYLTLNFGSKPCYTHF